MKRLLICIFIFDALLIFAAAKDVNNVIIDRSSNGTTFQKYQAAFGATCMPLSTINGQVNYLQTNPSLPYSSGTTAILTCNMGFSITGSSNSICINSIWSPPLGTCILSGIGLNGMNGMNVGGFGNGNGVGHQMPLTSGRSSLRGSQCFALLPPINGQLRYSQNGVFGSYPSGTTVSLACNPGLVQVGPLISTCEGGSWQPQSVGFCTNTGGGNGFSINGVTTASGSSIGPPSVTMVSSIPLSMGGGNMPQCTTLSSPNNGRITYSLSQVGNGYPVGTIATLLCDPGLVPSQMTAICGASGVWSAQIGLCSPLSDPAGGRAETFRTLTSRQCIIGLLPPLGSIINYSNGEMLGPYPSGTIAILNCHIGTPMGTSSSTCESGQWNPPFFQGCTMWQNGASGRVFQDMPGDISPRSSNPFLSLQQPALGNMPGMLPSMGMDLSNVCTLGVPPVVGGTITYSQGGDIGPYPAGTVANLQCNDDQPLGLVSSSCLSGKWQPLSIGPCGQGSDSIATKPPSPSVGPNLPIAPTLAPDFISPPVGLPQSVTISIPTNPIGGVGAGFPPPALGELGLNGGMLGLQCLLPLLPPLNGQITYGTPTTLSSASPSVPPSFGPYAPGTRATLTCNPGFSVSGPSTATCRAGMFEPILGQCMPGMSGMPAGNLSGVMPSPANDDPTAKNDNADEAHMSTTQRFGNASNDDIVDDTSEEDDFPIGCTDISHGSPGSGHVIYSAFGARDSAKSERNNNALPTTPTMIKHSVGSVAKLECGDGFISIGDTTARCESQGWTLPTLGKCTRAFAVDARINRTV